MMKKEIEEKLDTLFEELVPPCGPADTVAGEIIRAYARLQYRLHNDGDFVGVDYGNETCNAAARYLEQYEFGDTVKNLWPDRCSFEPDYVATLEELGEEIVKLLESYPNLKDTPNQDDYLNYWKESDLDYMKEESDWEW